jgi:predicted GIY-YIG superfamily endonuclease
VHSQDLKYCVYKITSPSGKYYFGYTSDFKSRMRQHKSKSKSDKNSILYNSIRKYGWDSHKKEIVFQSNEMQNALNFESALISVYKNTLNIAEGGIGGIRSEKHRQSISKSMTEKRKDPNYKIWRRFDLKEVYINIKPLIEKGYSESMIIAETGYSKGTIYRAKKENG